jgi:hypothetical protein
MRILVFLCTVVLSSALVIVLDTEPKVQGIKPGQGRWIIMTSFGWKEKLSSPCRKISLHVKLF